MTQEKRYISIGGQALIEGVMMRGPERITMAVRHTSGEIRTETMPNKMSQRPAPWRIPFVRGVFNFVDSMVLGYKCLMRSMEMSGLEDEAVGESKAEKKDEGKKPWWRTAMMVGASVLGFLLAIFLFIWLPTAIYNLLKSFIPFLANQVLQAVFEGLFKLAIFIAYVWAVSFMEDIHRVFMYHGAEHKTIFCFEHGQELTTDNVRRQSRFHPRCGTSFIVLLLLVSIFVSIFIPHTLPTLSRTLIKLCCLPIVMGLGYEALKLAGRKDNLFTRVISAPGLWVQRLTTKEPTDDMIECAVIAFKDVLPEDAAAVFDGGVHL
ncbi:MAG: DUF1385 domain-containing protein [Firmicutes bacterium]|nr:DUF1385 domain-containing protein [Bacillota bacterium]